MTRVVCHREPCVFWDAGVCGADEIILDPEELACTTLEDIKGLMIETDDLESWEKDDDSDDDEWGDEDEALLGNGEDGWQPY